MPVYPVDENPKLITGTFSDAYVLKNSGTQTIYLGQDSSLTLESRSFSITPNSVLQWPAKASEIWAMTDPGKSSELEILYTSQAVYTPGPSKVTILSNTDYLNRALLNIPSGSVAPISIMQTSVAEYATIALTLANLTAAPATHPDRDEIYRIDILWTTDTPFGGNTLVKTDTIFNSRNGRAELVTQVKGESFQLSITPMKAFTQAVSVNVFVYGYNYVIPDTYKHSWYASAIKQTSNITVNAAVQTIGGVNFDITLNNVPNPQSGDYLIDHVSGAFNAPNMRVINPAGTLTYEWRFLSVVGASLGATAVLGGASDTTAANQLSWLPRAPVVLTMFALGTSVAFQLLASAIYHGVGAEQ